MRPILSILIYSNSWVALCVASLVFGIGTRYNLRLLHFFVFWSYLGTVSAYQLHRLIRLKQLHHTVRTNRRLLWMQNTYTIQLCWFIVHFACFVFTFLFFPITGLGCLLLSLNAVIVTLYVLPIPILGYGIRNLPFAKNILISISWVLIVLIPFASTKQLDTLPLEVTLLVFIAVFAQIIPFDSRDLPHDFQQLQTIPQLFGLKAAKIIGFSLLLIALFLQYSLIGFHWIVIPIILTGAIGHFISFRVGYQLRQEFIWELPLGLMGLWFLLR